MRKLFGVLIFALMIFVLGACSSNSKANTISAADLSERESAILSTASEHSFVFDFHLASESKKVSVWIEKYKDGELVDDKLNKLSLMAEGNGAIIFTTPKEKGEEKKRTFNIGISSNGSTGSTVRLDNDVDQKLSFSGSFKINEKSVEEEEAVLAGIIYSEDKKDTISLRSSFYEDPSELQKYDVVYLFKAEFQE
ncbi:hypothetical protein [Halobacillus ihumii]|uniref:hypothetical protein n=1 Tax=Halobacillus ihumii TaxID=2686092 RepID=UPI0013D82395|nr:hypothetical protein [Halobacillus ihumii]